MSWYDVVYEAHPFLMVVLFGAVLWVLIVRHGALSDEEPCKGHTVLSVNGETALVRVCDIEVVVQNPFPDLVVGDVVHVREQGSGFAPYSVITHIYR